MADVEAEQVPPEEGIEEEYAGAGEEGALIEAEEDFVAVGGATEVKLFGKWSFDDIEIRDISLVVSNNNVIYKFVARSRKVKRSCMLSFYLSIFFNRIDHYGKGLHRLQGRSCYVPTPHCWTLPEEEVPEGIVSDC